LKKQNKYDGLIHNDDGSRQFTDGLREIVGGVNDFSKKKHSTKPHKKHHMSQAHTRNDDDDAIRAANEEELNQFKKGVQDKIKAEEENKAA